MARIIVRALTNVVLLFVTAALDRHRSLGTGFWTERNFVQRH